MMDIRCNSKNIKEFKELYNKNSRLFPAKEPNNICISLDDSVEDPLIMAKMNDGKLIEWTRGYENVKSFLSHGYVRIIQKCPFRLIGKCLGEKCQLYLVRNATGDCSIKWQAILKFNKV
ncbi:MAG: hypothetical protein JSV88_14005 [Candidatus Aminicenantes bacterium]|nr:MAG: hypothetical protein JSV88_14005 [Candidatus Aminicenantes bacterium]